MAKRKHDAVCKQCGQAYKSRRPNGKFCSRACWGAYRKGKSRGGITWHEFTCEECGELFRARAKNRRFCSQRCASSHNNRARTQKRVGATCDFCGREIELRPGDLAKNRRRQKHIFCSRKCSQQAKKGERRPQTSAALIEAYKNGLQHRKRFRGGYREDIGTYVRSSWEANFARVLNHLGIRWEYEPQTFTVVLDNQECTYTPDFYLPDSGRWVEVKGRWVSPVSKRKFEVFADCHQIKLVRQRFYTWLCRRYGNTVDWEGKRYG